MAISLVEALSKMAGALADKKFEQGARLMRAAETMNQWDARRIAKESKAVKLLDDSSKLRASVDRCAAAVDQLRERS